VIPKQWKDRAISIHACFASLEMQKRTIATIKNAELVMGYDPTTDNAFIVWGRPLIANVAALPHVKSVQVPILVVALDQSTQQLEILLAAVEVAHGHHEYLSDDDKNEIAELEALFRKVTPEGSSKE
jgi:hypothetical protein